MTINAELQAVLDSSRRTGLPAQAVANVEEAIQSSPVVANILNHAANKGQLKGFTILSGNEHADGHYDNGCIAIDLDAIAFPADSHQRSQQLDYLTSILAHEGIHATLAGIRKGHNDQFSMAVNNMTVPDSPSPHDYTAILGAALKAARADESVAQTWAWNALQSRIEQEQPGHIETRGRLLRGMFTDLVEEHGSDLRMKPGITLEPDGSIRMDRQHLDDFEPVAKHYYDQPAAEAKLGKGNSDYVNYYAARRQGVRYRSVHNQQHVNDLPLQTYPLFA